MTVHTPRFYGLIVRKSEKTAEYVARCNATHRDRYPDVPHNEDEHLMAVTIAMSGDDLDYVISRFEAQGWVRNLRRQPLHSERNWARSAFVASARSALLNRLKKRQLRCQSTDVPRAEVRCVRP